MIQEILVDGKPFKVKRDFLHRGLNPRLVLFEKQNCTQVWIQFENNGAVVRAVDGQSYRGYWCNGKKADVVLIKIEVISDFELKNKTPEYD